LRSYIDYLPVHADQTCDLYSYLHYAVGKMSFLDLALRMFIITLVFK